MKQKYKIVYLISHGHTARGAFQTGLLTKLNEAGIEVVIIAKKGVDNLLKKSVEKQSAIIDLYHPNVGKWDTQLSILRTFIYQNIKENPALLEKHLRRIKDDKSSLKRKFINKLYYYVGNGIRKIPFLKKLYIRFEKKHLYNVAAEKLLVKHKPDAIISTRPVDTMEIELLNAATKLNIHKIMYILSWDNITSKGVFPELADSYFTWGKIMNEELKEYYNVKEEQIYTTGVTHFDVHANVRNNPPKNNIWLEDLNLDSKKPYIFFTMSASYYAPNEIDIIEWLSSRIEQNTFGDNMQFIIRPHMINLMEEKSEKNWIDRLRILVSKRVVVDFPKSDNSLLTWYMKNDDMLKLSNLINGASVCLNSGSTIAIEAIAFNKPVILTMFDIEEWPVWASVKRIRDYIHLKKFLSYGAVDVANSLKHMEDLLLEYLNNKNLKEKERKKLLEAECYKVDGLSTDRFVKNSVIVLNKLKPL